METRLENSQRKAKALERCTGVCHGRLRADVVTRVFRRTGSAVEVILENIPAQVCPLCGRAFFARAVAHEIDHILLPFHGRHAVTPKLPPARVIIDFNAARRNAA